MVTFLSSWSLKTENTQKPNWSVYLESSRWHSFQEVGYHHLSFTSYWPILLLLLQFTLERTQQEQGKGHNSRCPRYHKRERYTVTSAEVSAQTPEGKWPGDPVLGEATHTQPPGRPHSCQVFSSYYITPHSTWLTAGVVCSSSSAFTSHQKKSGVVTIRATTTASATCSFYLCPCPVCSSLLLPKNSICGERYVPTSCWREAWCSLQPQRLSQLESITAHSWWSRDSVRMRALKNRVMTGVQCSLRS